jgi:hypothetical protein
MQEDWCVGQDQGSQPLSCVHMCGATSDLRVLQHVPAAINLPGHWLFLDAPC